MGVVGVIEHEAHAPDYPIKYSQNKKGSNITHTLKSVSRTRMNNNILFFE